MTDEMRIVVQLAIGLVFLLSASGKVLNPAGFARGVKEYQILPEPLAYVAGLLLIPLEFFLAASHLSGWQLAYAAPVGLATLASFAFGVTINLRRGRALPCYCFGGEGGEPISGRTLARLILLLAGEAFLLADPGLFSTSKLIYPDRIDSISQFGAMLFWALFVLVMALWILSITDVIELVRDGLKPGTRSAGSNSRSTQHPPESS